MAAARRIGTPRVIGISTDKACSPINAYGFTKALMERMFAAEALERPDGPAFTDGEVWQRYCVPRVSSAHVSGSGGTRRAAHADGPRHDALLDHAWTMRLTSSSPACTSRTGTPSFPTSRSSSMRVMAEAVRTRCADGDGRQPRRREEARTTAEPSRVGIYVLVGYWLRHLTDERCAHQPFAGGL